MFDRDDVVAAIPEVARMAGRIATESGSFLDRVPRGADIYLLVRVLHDWSDADCRRILKNCGAAMKGDAHLLICEQILEPDPARGDPIVYLIDTHMMAMFGTARERSEAEFRNLLDETGFAFRRLIRRPRRSSLSSRSQHRMRICYDLCEARTNRPRGLAVLLRLLDWLPTIAGRFATVRRTAQCDPQPS